MSLRTPNAPLLTYRIGAIAAVLVTILSVTTAAEANEPTPSPSPSVSPAPAASDTDTPEATSSPSPSPEPTVAPSPAPTAPTEEPTAPAQPTTSAAVYQGANSTVNAPATVRAGSSVTVTMTSAGGQDGTGTVWYRTATSWVQSSITFAINDGVGTVNWVPQTSRSYRIETTFGVTSPIFAISKEDPERRAATIAFNAADYVSGEMIWLRGHTYKAGVGYKAKLVIERRSMSGTSWSTLTTISSNSSGYFAYRMVATGSYVYRSRIVNTYAYSGPASVAALSSDTERTLEDRAADLSWLTGAPTSAITPISSSVLPDGVVSARFRNYSKGALVEVTTSSSVRTWFMYDRIYSHYVKSGRWAGSLGLPLRDMKCALLEGGCVQRFRQGSLYTNSSSSSPGVYVGWGTGVESEIVATARSQAGYEELSWRNNKFNAWVDGNAAWCSVFVSWAGAASGNPGMIPVKKTYEGYVSALQASGRLHYSGTPPVGAAVLFDWGTGNPTHSGLVRGYAGTTRIATIEGNTTDGSGDPQRGVYERTRLISDVWAWYMPSEK
jgi:hypothetical protein